MTVHNKYCTVSILRRKGPDGLLRVGRDEERGVILFLQLCFSDGWPLLRMEREGSARQFPTGLGPEEDSQVVFQTFKSSL
jgi:hypothetical protein